MKLIFFLSITGISMLIAFLISQYKIEEDKNNLEQKIENLFVGERSIMDGEYFQHDGYFTSDDEMLYIVSNGGVNIIQLIKENDGYKKVITSTSAISYKTPKTRYIPAQYWEGMKISNSYNVKTNRESIESIFQSVFHTLVTDQEKGMNSKMKNGIYGDLKNFPVQFKSVFFEVQGETAYLPSEGKYQGNNYEVYCPQNTHFYKIKPKKETILKSKVFIYFIGAIIGILISLIAFKIFFKKQESEYTGNNQFFVKWKSNVNNSILSFEKNVFGKVKVQLIEHNMLKKGTADLENQNLIINFPDSQFLYLIVSLNKDQMILQDLTTNENITYSRIGRN